MGRRMEEIGELDVGDFVVFNEEPCMITKKSDASPKGKENTKEKVYLEGLFDGQKRTFVEPVDETVEVPLIERGRAQIVAIIENSAQLIDLKTYETFELTIPLELRGEVEEGDEIEYVQALGRKKIERKNV